LGNRPAFETEILIVGAGFAGAATAYHLSREYKGRILLVDKEKKAGTHASGRNASLLFQPSAPDPIRELLIRSRHAYEGLRKEIDFRQNGSLLLGREEELTQQSQDPRVGSRLVDAETVRQRIPLLSGHTFEAALWTESDGVVDIRRLLNYYLDGARKNSVKLQLNCEIQQCESSAPFRFRSNQGTIQAQVVINAAGAWAGSFGNLCGATPIPLFPLKRHLFVLEGMSISMEEGPFVWDTVANFYFRPEAGGLMFCICDEEPSNSLLPTVSSEIREQLAEVIWKYLPGLRDAVQREAWACFRTATEDGLFALGWDASLKGFFWVAGLGGSGMGSSWGVGEEAARLLRAGPEAHHPQMNPARLGGKRLATGD
jgi:D-arginine dehydrogenase